MQGSFQFTVLITAIAVVEKFILKGLSFRDDIILIIANKSIAPDFNFRHYFFGLMRFC